MAGIALLAREGVEAATMRRLAAAAHCTTGAVTHHFENRDELLVAMLRRVHAAAGERMLSAIRLEATPRARLKGVLLNALPLDRERLIEWKVWLAFWGVVSGAPHLAAEHARRYQEWHAILQPLVRENGVRGESVNELTAHLVATIDGFGLRLTFASAAHTPALRRHCLYALQRTLEAAGIEIEM
jgi:AcrR family transcriptional regulator